LILIATDAAAQGLPRRTECLQWDQAYAQTVMLGIGGAAILAAVLGITTGFLFGRQFWFATSPRARIAIAGGIAFALVEFCIVVWPRVLPLGKLLYASVDAQYPACQTMTFGAAGLMGGVIGPGVAAYAQWQAITMLLAGAAAVGTLVAWIFSELIVKNRGLEATARRGEA
jgi:hypothetical protein